MKLLLCGDSWMNGSYELADIMEPTHPGLASYLVQDDHSVINLAVQGGSNELQLEKLELFFSSMDWTPDTIIFMQCPLFRRFRNYRESDYRRHTDNRLLHNAINNKDFDFTANNIDDIIAPIIDKLANNLKAFNIPVIIASGNTKMHPNWKLHFNHVMCSGDSYWSSHVDSYFGDKESVENFLHLFIKNSKLDRQTRTKIAIEIMNDFNTKMDAWQNNSTWIAHQHGRLIWHQKLYEEIQPFLSTLSK